MQAVDTIIDARWVIPVEPAQQVLEHHSVAVHEGRIVEVLPTAQVSGRYHFGERVTLGTHALIPGLVNAHTHSAMSLFRGLADDLPLMRWLKDFIWPAEARWVSRDFCRDGVLLAAIEMLKGGTTCFNDMYFFPDATAAAAREARMRACIGLIVIDFPTAWARDVDEYLAKGLELRDDLRTSELITTALAPHAPYTVSDDALGRIRVLADQLDLPIHMHVHETAGEVSDSEAARGERPLTRLKNAGLLSPRLMAVHMTQLSGAEIALLAQEGVHVIHCPESNLKTASGFCPTAQLDAAGVNIALGTDGAASNNDLDLLGEMRMAALLAKGGSGDPTAMPAHRALAMATLQGARALGIEDRVGSIVPHKAADLAAIDLSHVSTQPVYDPLSQVVYSASRNQVSDVWVGGQRLLRNGHLTHLDEQAVLQRAREWRDRIAGSLGETARAEAAG
ncbi:MAG: TRZ/ATZ family hydrolase [Acidiferrobacteraceae bacterium]